MIDFKNGAVIKLHAVKERAFSEQLEPLLATGEEIIGTYKAMRDGVVFTNKRLISINIQGVTGLKKDFTSMPYRKIQTFSIETAGVFDMESELEIWFSTLGKVRFEFTGKSNVTEICRWISEHSL